MQSQEVKIVKRRTGLCRLLRTKPIERVRFEKTRSNRIVESELKMLLETGTEISS